jgi:hypothetical protein
MRTKSFMRAAPLLLVLGALSVSATACKSGQTSAANAPESKKKFVFAPRVGLVFRHEMKNLEELTVPNSSYRDSVESRVLWEVTVTEQSDGKYIYKRRLVELGLTVNGAAVLTGKEVEPRRAEIQQVMTKDGHVVDVTGTEQLTQTLVGLVREPAKARVAEMFSAENLRELLRARAVDAFEEVVGKPADVGSSWSAKENFGPLKGKMVYVDSAIGCGGRSCVKLKRAFDVDQQKVGESVRLRMAGFLKESGADPAAVKLVDSNLKVEDTFVVESDTCHFHDSTLLQEGQFVFEGAQKNRLQVVLTSKQTSHAEYPPPT